MNVLEIRNLSKHYDGFSLENLSLTLPEGCVLGLVGENGAGKTTTIKIILDMLHSDGGTVTVLGQDSRGNVAVKQDLGVAFLPEAFALPALKSGEIARLTLNTPLPTRQLILARRSGQTLSIAAKAFEKMVLSCVSS